MSKRRNRENQVTEVSAGISVREAGRRGGTATRDRHGVEFLREIAKRGGETTKRRYAHLFSEFGRKGGRPRRPNLNETPGGEHSETKEEAVGPSAPYPAKE